MHEPLLLTINEMRELTGYKYGCKVKFWLEQNGFCFTMGRDGYPRVLREHLKDVMGLKTTNKRRAGPDLDGLRKKINGTKKTSH